MLGCDCVCLVYMDTHTRDTWKVYMSFSKATDSITDQTIFFCIDFMKTDMQAVFLYLLPPEIGVLFTAIYVQLLVLNP